MRILVTQLRFLHEAVKLTHMLSYAKRTGSNWCVLWWHNFDYYIKPSDQHTCNHMLKQLALIDACYGDTTSIITTHQQSYAKATGSNWCVLWWRNFDYYMTLTHIQSYAKGTGSNWCAFWWHNFDHYTKPSNQHTFNHMLKELALIDAHSGDATSIISYAKATGSNWCVLWFDTHAIIC